MSGKSPDQDDEPGRAQARVETGLVNREQDAPDGLADGLRIGPYIVVGELVTAPGVRIAEGRDLDGQRVLLQLARCRSAETDEQKSQRQDYVRMVAAATEHLSADADLAIHSHGAIADPDGTRTLFWALPWIEGAERLGRATTDIKTLDQLVAAATSLLERLANRHERGRLDPLLSEQVLVAKKTGAVEVAGVPIHLPDEWLVRDAPPARLAPEERETKDPTASGDLYRAGLVLRAVSAQVDPVPDAFAALVEALTADNPAARPSSARDVLLELESMDGTLAASRDPSEPDEALAPPMRSISADESHVDDDDDDEASEPRSERDTDSHAKADLQAASEALTIQPHDASAGTGSERPTKPPGIWSRAKEQQTVRVPYPSASASPKSSDAAKRTLMDEPAEDIKATLMDKGIDFPAVPNATSIPEAPTLLDARQPSRETFTKGPDRDPPSSAAKSGTASMFTKTLIDEPMPDLSTDASDVVLRTHDDAPPLEGATANDPASELTLRDVSRADLEARHRADDSEHPTMDDSMHRDRRPGPPTKKRVWDESHTPSKGMSAAAAAAAAGSGPMGPKGTIVGMRLIQDPTGLRPVPNLPRLLPPGGQMHGRPPAGLLPPGPPLEHQIPVGDTVAGQPPLAESPAGLALRARSIQPAPSDTGMVPPGGWPDQQQRSPVPVSSPRALMAPESQDVVPASSTPLDHLPPLNELPPYEPPPAYDPPAPSPPPYVPPSGSHPGAARAEVPDRTVAMPRTSKGMIFGAIAFFATGCAVAFILSYLVPRSTSPTANLGRSRSAIPAQTKPYAIGPASEVVLEASPREATVLSERTGRIIGKTPVRFLVPPGVSLGVMVAAEGYEPQRIVLPERGRISTDLVKLGPNERCRVSIAAPEGIGLEGYAGEVEVGTRFQIPGSVLLRSEGHGAWLVRCPKFGGVGEVTLDPFPPPRGLSLEVTGPWGAEIAIDGKKHGKVPVSLNVANDFYEVQATDDEGTITRWVALFGETQLKMPKPRTETKPTDEVDEPEEPAKDAEEAKPDDEEEEEEAPKKKRRKRRRR